MGRLLKFDPQFKLSREERLELEDILYLQEREKEEKER